MGFYIFATILNPLTDVRAFLNVEHRRLALPTWPLPGSGAYLRGFGRVMTREGGGVEDWPGEEVYCDASSAIKFKPELCKKAITVGERTRFTIYPLFRRLFFDGRFADESEGSVVCRLEIGFRLRFDSDHTDGPSSDEFLQGVRQLLSFPVIIPNPECVNSGQSLFNVGRPLAARLLASSTRRLNGVVFPTQNWWLSDGTPRIILSFPFSQTGPAFRQAARPVGALARYNVSLWHLRVQVFARKIGVWCIDSELGKEAESSPPKAVGVRRKLRLNLCRLHAEKEALRQVLRLIAQSYVTGTDESKPWQRLRDFLASALALLTKKEKCGLPVSEILDAAVDYEDLVTPGERVTLINMLQSLKLDRWRHFQDFERRQAEPQSGTVLNVSGGSVSITLEQNKVMNEGNLVFGDKNVVGNVNPIIAGRIQNSFNRVANSAADSQLQSEVKKLHEQFVELVAKLPEEKRESATRDLETLTGEVASQSPRRPWYELSAKGLIDAAKTVGEVAAPIISTVKVIVGLLGGSL